MSRRRLIIGAAAVTAVLVAALLVRRPSTNEEEYSLFCGLYPRIEKMTAMLERGLEGRSEPGDLPPSNYRNLRELVWSDKNAESGPDQFDEEAVLIASAVRAAATEENPAPLQTEPVRDAVASLGPSATEFCVDVGA